MIMIIRTQGCYLGSWSGSERSSRAGAAKINSTPIKHSPSAAALGRAAGSIRLASAARASAAAANRDAQRVTVFHILSPPLEGSPSDVPLTARPLAEVRKGTPLSPSSEQTVRERAASPCEQPPARVACAVLSTLA